jgi:hypothetical protein
METYINIFSSLLTPIIAILAVWIAYQQMKSNRDKIRLELFESRMKIFSILRESLGKIITDGSPQNIEFKEFYFAVEQSRFLLNKDLQFYIDEIEKKVRKMRSQDILLYGINGNGGLPVGEQRNKICDENTELLKWLVDQIEPLQTKFSDFMKLNKI